ncbi:hypothetical protein Tco_0960870 [Tanacetum coccineum]
MNSQPKNQFEHVDDFDIDDSDLRPTAALRPCNREHQTRDTIRTIRNLVPSTQTPEIDYFDEMAIRIISGPAADYRNVGGDVDLLEFRGISAVGRKVVVTVVKSYTPNALGDLSVTLKDPLAMFSPKQSPYSLNITTINVVKVFLKDIVLGDGTGVGGSGVLDEEEIINLLEEKRAKV